MEKLENKTRKKSSIEDIVLGLPFFFSLGVFGAMATPFWNLLDKFFRKYEKDYEPAAPILTKRTLGVAYHGFKSILHNDWRIYHNYFKQIK